MIRRFAVDLTEGLASVFSRLAGRLDRRPWLMGFAALLIMLEVWLVFR